MIAILGGHTLYEIGTVNEIDSILNQIDSLSFSLLSEQENSVLKRLYSSYVLEKDLDTAITAITKIHGYTNDPKISLFCEKLLAAIESARSFSKEFGLYQAVRLVRSDMPEFMMDKKRPLSEYDTHKGEPFWKRK